MGTFTMVDDECIIEICTPDRTTNRDDAFPLTLRRTMLHELGHCWADAYADDQAKGAFLELRGLQCWSCDTAWEDKGCEHAAEIMEWGTIDTPGLCRVLPNDCASLASAFQTLTGKTPIRRSFDCSDEPIDYFE